VSLQQGVRGGNDEVPPQHLATKKSSFVNRFCHPNFRANVLCILGEMFYVTFPGEVSNGKEHFELEVNSSTKKLCGLRSKKESVALFSTLVSSSDAFFLRGEILCGENVKI